MRVRFKLLHELAKVPVYAKPGDSGADLYAIERCELVTGQPVVVPFGIAIELPEGYEAQIRPRSSLSKSGVHVALGTIDAGYRGPLGATVTLLLSGERWSLDEQRMEPVRYVIRPGDRIAQLVIAPVSHAAFEPAEELTMSERGESGWGSSGR
jgi:dUTP pyrophosphatase